MSRKRNQPGCPLHARIRRVQERRNTRCLSCSIGAYRFISPMEIKELLSETDRALYAAKENGRACYVIRGDGIPAHT